MQQKANNKYFSETNDLVHLVIDKYHAELRDYITIITKLLDKSCNLYGNDKKYLLDVKSLFNKWSAHILFHLDREEQILFPLILKSNDDSRICKNVEGLLNFFEQEHKQDQEVLDSLQMLLQDYQIQQNDEEEIKRLKILVKDMGENLREHIAIENEQIFARFKS